jgi:LacI family transcriptional regulator
MTAMGVMRKSHATGIVIPRDLSVVGFDNIRITEYMLPPLTTIEMSQTELARIAFRALLEDVQRKVPDPKGTEYVLKTGIILRESTALNANWSGKQNGEPA